MIKRIESSFNWLLIQALTQTKTKPLNARPSYIWKDLANSFTTIFSSTWYVYVCIVLFCLYLYDLVGIYWFLTEILLTAKFPYISEIFYVNWFFLLLIIPWEDVWTPYFFSYKCTWRHLWNTKLDFLQELEIYIFTQIYF